MPQSESRNNHENRDRIEVVGIILGHIPRIPVSQDLAFLLPDDFSFPTFIIAVKFLGATKQFDDCVVDVSLFH